MGVSETYFGVLIIRILLFGVLYWGPLFSETPIYSTTMELGPKTTIGVVFRYLMP